MKIRIKLTLTYLTLSVLALIFISTFFYFYGKSTLKTEVLRHLESVSSLQKHRIEGIVEQNLERIGLVSSRTQLRISLNNYLVSKKDKDFERLRLILNDALGSISSFNVISILDKTGRVIVSTDSSRMSMNYSQYDFFSVAHEKHSAGNFFLDTKNRLEQYLSGPLWLNNALIGILLIETDAANIVSSVCDYSGLGKTGETLLGEKSQDGQYVVFLMPVRFDKAAALRRKIEINNVARPLVKALSQKPLLTKAVDYRGNGVLAATNYINKTNWGLVVKIDEQEAFEPIVVLVKYIVIITLGLMFFVVWVSYALASIISKPIVELTKVANEIDEGDLAHRAKIESNDEVGELAATFNNMTNNLIRTQLDLESSNKELHSHRDHLEEMVAARTRELQTTIDELESFSYSVSHDLRSPLRAIDGYSYLLMEKCEHFLDEEGKSNFRRMRLAAQRMGALIDDLLNLSRINRGKIVREKIDLSAKVELAISRLDIGNALHRAEFVVQPDLSIYADVVLMDIVVDNLIDNAWKYTIKNPSARIEFGAMTMDGKTVYFVRDNGIGFDMQYSDKLFGAFQRLVGNDEYPGTGIGLATVSRVIQRHGGRIWAEGEPGKGASFYFTVSQD
jgi:signal transduction histidine kinase